MTLIRNSQIRVTEPFDMADQRVIRVSTPITGSDATTKFYVDQHIWDSGSGDMYRSTYDPNLNGYVDSSSFAITASYLINFDNLENVAYTDRINYFTEFLFKPERTSYAGSIDVGFNNKYYVVLEFGISEIDLEKDNYHYLSDGSFWKLGMDFNMLKKVPTDFFGIGLRVGRASFEHYAKDVIIGDDHWGSFTTTIDSKSYNTYWFETSLGVKGELLKNIYFGWSALVRISVSGRKDSEFQPYYIPGFGKGENSLNLGLNYFIYYQIPFNRK